MCDLAETYHIYDMYQHSPSRIAVFCNGLGADSRVKKALNGLNDSGLSLRYLLAVEIDAIHMLIHTLSGSGKAPASIADIITGKKRESAGTGNQMTFESAEDFETVRAEILKGGR